MLVLQAQVTLAATVQYYHLLHSLGATFLMKDAGDVVRNIPRPVINESCACGDRCAFQFYQGFVAVRHLLSQPHDTIAWDVSTTCLV